MAKLRSLRDMYELEAAKYHDAIVRIQQSIALVDGRNRIPPGEIMNTSDLASTIGLLDQVSAILGPVAVPVTKLAIRDYRAEMTRAPGKLDFFGCCQMLLHLSETLRRELETVKVFSLDANRAAFYAPLEPLFGPDVNAKFQSITYEIDQAGKCYACDLTSASAFHSIRCLEAGIRAVARCVGIPDPTKGKDRNWSNVSRSIKDEMDKRWPATSGRMSGDAKIFDEIYGSLSGMQNPYRNATMHLDAKYTAPEALHIFELVKGLLHKIALRMDENGDPKA